MNDTCRVLGGASRILEDALTERDQARDAFRNIAARWASSVDYTDGCGHAAQEILAGITHSGAKILECHGRDIYLDYCEGYGIDPDGESR